MSDNCHACGAPFRHRSWASHGHYFALLNEKYQTLPEAVTKRLPSLEHFRKYALVKTGWRNELAMTLSTDNDAHRAAMLARMMDSFAIVSVEGRTVIVWTAESQSLRVMGKERFQRSKDDVLAYADHLLGVPSSAIGEEKAA